MNTYLLAIGLSILGLFNFSLSAKNQDDGKKVKAVIVILARNGDIGGLQHTIPQFERRFNAKHNYPYVYLNEVPFTEEFKAAMKNMTSAKIEFGLIPTEHWSYPSWIDVPKADVCRADFTKRHVIYGWSLPYRHMCRFNSGFFFRHELLKDYDYYWRVEPSVNFTCNVLDDPFVFMKENGKEYGFTLALSEYKETIPTLWNETVKFVKANPQYLHKDNIMKDFLMDANGDYNLCHFWSNFEIGSLNLWRSEAYLKYFEHLDKAGGFFYERWGDAPVHSIAAAMFLPKHKIHHFDNIGYFHNPITHCPQIQTPEMQCECNRTISYTIHSPCMKVWNKTRSVLIAGKK